MDSPDVFRLSREAAEKGYGKTYAAVDQIHPELSKRIPFAEKSAEFDLWFGTSAASIGTEDRTEPIESTKKFLARAAEHAAEDRQA